MFPTAARADSGLQIRLVGWRQDRSFSETHQTFAPRDRLASRRHSRVDFFCWTGCGMTSGARFTCLRYMHPIGKRFYIDSTGLLQKQTLADGVRATAHIVACESIERLEQAFLCASAGDIFVGGLPSSDGLTVVTKAKRVEGEIARTKDDFPFPQGPGVMFLDNDHPVGKGDDQFDAYVKAVPTLAAASYVYAPSSSAWIHEAASGKPLKGVGGQHYAVPVRDASDIPRALKALHQRLVLAGLGMPMVTKAGTVLIKSPVDTAMQSPNQPLFLRVSLGEGLVQRKADHIGSHRGDVFLFDSRLIADLTPEEQVCLADIERQLRESVANEASSVRGEWIEERVERVSARNEVTREVAAEYLRAVLAHAASTARSDLMPGIQIRFSNEWVDVGDLLASPSKYDGKPCADPIEPDYGSGIGVAKFYENAKTGKPTINSNAHGGQTFFLHHDPKEIDLSGILAKGVREDTNASQSTDTPIDVPRVMAQAAGSSLPLSSLPMADWIAALQQKKPAAKFDFVPAGDLVREPKPVEYLVDELIEHPSLMMLFGAPSAGKSFVAISMAACVATGHPWLGRDVRSGTVFYLAGEGHAGLSRRLRAWEIDTGVSLEGAPLFVSKLPAQLMDAENAQIVEQAIKTLSDTNGPPVLIVIDTLARNMGSGDESSNADIGTFVAHIDGMRHRLGCTVEIVHHSGHFEADRSRGASALPAAMDATFQMENKGGVRFFTQKKAKESEDAAPIPLKLKEVPIGWKDAKGREICSAVIVPADASEQALAGKPMPKSHQDAMQTFYTVAIEKGVESDGYVGVHLEMWRPYFYKTCSADSQSAKRQAFNRVRGALVQSGVLRLEFDTYSLDATDIGYVSKRLVKNMTVTS
jgi:AAA domain